MTTELKIKIGQMIAAGFPSPYVDEQAKKLMDDYFVGNFFVFARNLENAQQICALTNELHTRAYEKFGISPLICIDQEGGAVSRIVNGAALFPGAMAQGATGAKYARVCAKNCGEILKAMGITTTASPVMDVNIEPLNPIIGARAFSDDPETVAEYGTAMMHGFEEGGAIATVKHYPGHGNVKSDSHLELPINDTDLETLENTEFVPFKHAFKAGADLVMSAHVLYTALDKDTPATLSKKIATELLREKHGFKGVAMTDCMEMNAVKKLYGSGEAAVRAIEAGMDLLTVSHTLEAVDEIVNAIYRAVEEGRLTEERIDLSVERIRKLKEKYGLTACVRADAQKASGLMYDEEKIALHEKAAFEAVTLLSGDKENDFAFEGKKLLFLAPPSFALNNAEEDKGAPLSFAKEAAKAFGAEYIDLPINAFEEETQKRIQASDADAFVIGLYNARFREGQMKMLSALLQTKKPVLCVLLGAPYDFAAAKQAQSVVCAYEYTNLSVKGVIRALREKNFPGSLPVKI